MVLIKFVRQDVNEIVKAMLKIKYNEYKIYDNSIDIIENNSNSSQTTYYKMLTFNCIILCYNNTIGPLVVQVFTKIDTPIKHITLPNTIEEGFSMRTQQDTNRSYEFHNSFASASTQSRTINDNYHKHKLFFEWVFLDIKYAHANGLLGTYFLHKKSTVNKNTIVIFPSDSIPKILVSQNYIINRSNPLSDKLVYLFLFIPKNYSNLQINKAVYTYLSCSLLMTKYRLMGTQLLSHLDTCFYKQFIEVSSRVYHQLLSLGPPLNSKKDIISFINEPANYTIIKDIVRSANYEEFEHYDYRVLQSHGRRNNSSKITVLYDILSSNLYKHKHDTTNSIKYLKLINKYNISKVLVNSIITRVEQIYFINTDYHTCIFDLVYSNSINPDNIVFYTLEHSKRHNVAD